MALSAAGVATAKGTAVRSSVAGLKPVLCHAQARNCQSHNASRLRRAAGCGVIAAERLQADKPGPDMRAKPARAESKAASSQVPAEAPQLGIGPRIAFLRRQKAISLEDLAQKSGLTKSFLSKLERGLSVPSISTAMALAKSFGLTVW
jgi:DNA-binding XRE family transcriptional regulator